MTAKKILIITLVALFILTIINVTILADSTTIRVNGKGDAFKTVEGNTTTWGCNRQNENECSMVATSTK